MGAVMASFQQTKSRSIAPTESVIASQQSGVPFTATFVLNNDGNDGIINVRAFDGDQVVGEKLMAVNGDSWRIVEMEIKLEGADEHTIIISNLSATLTVE